MLASFVRKSHSSRWSGHTPTPGLHFTPGDEDSSIKGAVLKDIFLPANQGRASCQDNLL